MIIYTYEDYLKSILKLDISSVFLKKVLSKEDEEEEYEEEHTTEFMLCDVSENTFQIHQMKSTKKIKITIQKNRTKTMKKPKQTRM